MQSSLGSGSVPGYREPLADAFEARERFVNTLKQYLSIRDEQTLDIILATVAHSFVPDSQMLWITIVGNSSSGKSELAWKPFSTVESVHPIGQMTAHTFVTGLKGGKDLLPELNGKLVLIKDMTLISSLRSDAAMEILSQFRSIYDGEHRSNYGGEKASGGYRSRFDCIACTTVKSFEDTRKLTQYQGERFIPVRLRYDPEELSEYAGKHSGDLHMEGVIAAAGQAFAATAKSISSRFHDIMIPDLLQDQLSKICMLSAKLHMVVARDYRGQNFTEVPATESSGRTVHALTSLVKSLCLIYGDTYASDTEINIIRKVCYDSIQRERAMILEILYRLPGLSTEEIADLLSIPSSSAKIWLEDMMALRIIQYKMDGATKRYAVTDKILYDLKNTSFLNGSPIPPTKRNVPPEKIRDIINCEPGWRDFIS